MSVDNPKIGQGPAVEVTAEDEYKDLKLGFTHPNLHRRVDPKSPTNDKEKRSREYNLGIYGTESYRTTTVYLHDEDSETFEIP